MISREREGGGGRGTEKNGSDFPLSDAGKLREIRNEISTRLACDIVRQLIDMLRSAAMKKKDVWHS